MDTNDWLKRIQEMQALVAAAPVGCAEIKVIRSDVLPPGFIACAPDVYEMFKQAFPKGGK